MARRIGWLRLVAAKEGAGQHIGGNLAKDVASPTSQIVQDDLRRAEEHGVNLVEVPLVALENVGKGCSMIGRGRAGNFGPDFGKQVIFGSNPNGDSSTIQDGVIGAAYGADLVGG